MNVSYWTPTLAEVTYEFGSVHPFVHLQRKTSKLTHQISLIFCMKLDNHKDNHSKAQFLKKSQYGRVMREQKVQKMVQKWGFWGFDNSRMYSYVPFLLEYVSANGILTLWRNHMSGKNLAFKTSRPIRMQYSLNYNISQRIKVWNWFFVCC